MLLPVAVMLTSLLTLDERFCELGEEVAGRVESGEVSSLVVIVVDQGKVVWEESFGWQDQEHGVPASTATIYPVASLSKSITGLAAALLIGCSGCVLS